MRVLQLISSSGMYGAESVVLNLAKNLTAQGHDCIIGVFFHPQVPVPQLYEVAKASGLRTSLIQCDGQVDRAVLDRIHSIIREEKVDVLHTHGYKADVYARVASRNSTVPIVATCHTWHDTGLKDRLYGVLDRYALRGFDAVIAISAEVERRLLKAGISSKRVHRLRNGIDIEMFTNTIDKNPRSGDELVVGLACRLAYEKGTDLFARMAQAVLRQCPHARFKIAGEGDQRPALEALIQELNITSQVEIMGRVEDMPAFYASLDVLVSSSRSEGFPIGIIEAMASGLPIVATAVGDVPQIIQDGVTGILVQSGDVDALAGAAVSLLENAETRRLYGSRAREFAAQELSSSRMTSETIQIYRQALRSRAQGEDSV